MFYTTLRSLIAGFQSRQSLVLENLALRHQVQALKRGGKRPRIKKRDRVLWVRRSRFWRAPRIHGELENLGLIVSEPTVSKYMKQRRPPSQSWKTFLINHAVEIALVDFFEGAAATMQVLHVFIVLGHDRRRILRCEITALPVLGGLHHRYTRRAQAITLRRVPIHQSRSVGQSSAVPPIGISNRRIQARMNKQEARGATPVSGTGLKLPNQV